MKWKSVKSTIGYSVYALWNNGRKLVTLVFNSSSNAARIDYAGEKRVFLIRKEGFLKNKVVIRNEYGVKIGYAGTDVNGEFLEVNNERFFYSLDNSDKPTITIYKQVKDQPFAVCELDLDEKDIMIDLSGKHKSVKEDTRNSLLMTLCWFLFQPAKASAKKEIPLEYSLG
jgi:hypothetical protein